MYIVAVISRTMILSRTRGMRGLLVDDHRLPAPKRTYTGAYTVVFSGVAGSSYTGDIGIDTVRTRPRLLPTKSSL